MKNIIEMQTKEWRETYDLYMSLSPEERRDAVPTLSAFLQEKYGYTPAAADGVARLAASQFSAIPFDAFFSNMEEAVLTSKDISVLKSMLAYNPVIEERRLVIAFFIYARLNPHKSNWIKYDNKTISYLASLSNLKVSERQSLTSRLHKTYGLNMQVVGSSNPIPCFYLPQLIPPFQPAYLPDEDPSSLDSQVLVGPVCSFTVSTIEEFLRDPSLDYVYRYASSVPKKSKISNCLKGGKNPCLNS